MIWYLLLTKRVWYVALQLCLFVDVDIEDVVELTDWVLLIRKRHTVQLSVSHNMVDAN